MSREAVDDEEGYVGYSFLDLSPLRRSQSAPTTNPVLNKEQPVQPPVPKLKLTFFSRSSSPPTINYIKRISTFVLLELGFIILAALSLRKPIFVGLATNIDGAKGGFTVLFILWQTAAIIPLQHVILCILSHEWSVQWESRRTHNAGTRLSIEDSYRIDQVSTLTSHNLLDRFRFLIRGESSNSFKFAFVTSLALLGLAKLGPGSIGAAIIRRNVRVNVNVGRLTLGSTPAGGGDEGFVALALQRAQMVAYLEQMGNSQYGYDAPPNRIVGWPLRDSRTQGVEVIYPSDIVRFGSTCQWSIPSPSEGGGSISAAGEKWVLGPDTVQVPGDGGIMPLTPSNDIPLSAYLVYGSNDTYGTANSSNYVLDMGNVPALFNLTGIRVPLFPVQFKPPLLSVLVCDPRPELVGGYVYLQSNGALSITTNGAPIVGNIPQSAANFLFSRSLSMATRLTLERTSDTGQSLGTTSNTMSAQIFLDSPSNSTFPMRFQNLEDIAKRLDSFLLSASKGFTDGYTATTNVRLDQALATIPVQGTIQEEVTALTTNETLLILTIILSVFVVIMMTVLCTKAPESLQLFDLVTILRKVQDTTVCVNGE